jgi:hypothetical protein
MFYLFQIYQHKYDVNNNELMIFLFDSGNVKHIDDKLSMLYV